jgi:aspartate 1-decarboxylase
MIQNKKGKLMGDPLRISSATEEEFIERLKGTKGFIENGFMDEFRYHIVMKQRIARAAKVYLFLNWKKVKDWSKLNVSVRDNSKKTTKYYNHIPRESGIADGLPTNDDNIIRRAFAELEEYQAKQHNPVVTMDDMILDPTDEDFSIIVNGKSHNWISDDSVIVIADYVEEQLKEQEAQQSE